MREAGGDKLSYGNDYEIVTKLKKFSDHYGICLLVVHHTRKMEPSDSFDMISGTNGLLGAADGAFIMQKKKRTENRAILEVAGRDQQDQRLLLNFNREKCDWELTKAETELWKEPVDSVLESLAMVVTVKEPEWNGSASELLEILPEIDMQPNVLTRKLKVSLERLGIVNIVTIDTTVTEKGEHIEEYSNIGGVFIALIKFHMLDMEEVQPEIKKGLMDKMDSITMRLLYSKYKTLTTGARNKLE